MQYCLLFLLFVLRRTITASGSAPCLWPLLLPFLFFFWAGGYEKQNTAEPPRVCVCMHGRDIHAHPGPNRKNRLLFIHLFIYLGTLDKKLCQSIVGLCCFFFFSEGGVGSTGERASWGEQQR